MSNARIEATNNKIKLIIRKAYGFRNIQNMIDMVYLVCSDLTIVSLLILLVCAFDIMLIKA